MYCLTLVALRRVKDWSESTKYEIKGDTVKDLFLFILLRF